VSDLAAALEIVGSRWALRIVAQLLDGPQRYGDLQRDLGAGTNMLATRLRELETAGVLYRVPLHHNTRAYALTDRGLALRDAIAALERWGAAHAATTPDAADDPDSEPLTIARRSSSSSSGPLRNDV
jgi:DNA-binding HxlR family transcriptional regulator